VFDDVDETLRQLLVADVPIDRGEVDIAFDRPTREWSSRLSRPTLNLFLFDIRERTDFRDDTWVTTRTPDGQARRERGPRRVDLSYTVTAWANEAADEHRILSRVLASLYRQARVAPGLLQGTLAAASEPVLLRCMPPDHHCKPADFWGVMDNEMHASLTWVATVPLDVFAPVSGPIVRTRELLVGRRGEEGRESLVLVGGVARLKGEAATGIAGVRIRVAGTGLEAESGSDGRFLLAPMPRGEYIFRIETPDGQATERQVVVPAGSYDIEL
jgi:hypothetical protein